MSQNFFRSESLRMSMGRSVGLAPPHYFVIERWSDSPYINRFLSADTIVPGYTNPQSLNRYSYVLNNPVKLTDPTGHWADDGYVGNHGPINCHKYGQYCPGDRGSGNGHGGSSGEHHDGGHGQQVGTPTSQPPLLSILDNYNYAVGTPQITLYEQSTMTYDITVSGQGGFAYSNGSTTTVTLFPPGIRQTSPQLNSLSSNFTIDPDLNFTTGYGQSAASEALKAVTGFNLNPITGTLTSRTVISAGPYTISSSLSVKATIKPAETALGAATVAVAIAAIEPTPLGEAILGGAGYTICQATGKC